MFRYCVERQNVQCSTLRCKTALNTSTWPSNATATASFFLNIWNSNGLHRLQHPHISSGSQGATTESRCGLQNNHIILVPPICQNSMCFAMHTPTFGSLQNDRNVYYRQKYQVLRNTNYTYFQLVPSVSQLIHPTITRKWQIHHFNRDVNGPNTLIQVFLRDMSCNKILARKKKRCALMQVLVSLFQYGYQQTRNYRLCIGTNCALSTGVPTSVDLHLHGS